MPVFQSTCLSGVKMNASRSETRNQVAVKTERPFENHLSMIVLYNRKNSATKLIHTTSEKAVNMNPAVVISIRNATAATMPNAVAATAVSGNSNTMKLSDKRFIKINHVIRIYYAAC